MHTFGRYARRIDDPFALGRSPVKGIAPDGDAFTEVGFEAIDTHSDEVLELTLIPGFGDGIRKVDERHSRLPTIPLPDVARAGVDKVIVIHALSEQRRLLCDIRIDPHTDADALVV